MAAFGLSRPSVFAQVFSQAVAWLLFAATAIAAVAAVVLGHTFSGPLTGIALASGAALAFARPALSTKQARAEFAPVAYRRWFLASTTVSVAAAAVAGLAGLAIWSWDHHWESSAIGAFALSVSLLASAVGVLRMRAWGVLLSGATALLAIGTALFMRANWVGFEWAAVPGVMFGYPVLASRLRREATPRTQAVLPTRAPIQGEDARVRVAVVDSAVLGDQIGDHGQAEASVMDVVQERLAQRG
jgi:hypothetical protein